jgi:hypothetical protein
MALVEAQSGTQAATLDTEHTLGSEETTDGWYWLVVDTSAMANADVLVLRAKLKVKTAGTARLVARATFRDAQEQPAALSIPIPNIYGLTFTLEQTDGTGRSYDWSILRST